MRLLLLGIIGLYRVSIGKLAGGRCRFHPSCSAYAYVAIRELGAVRGSALAAWRVLRCGPWTAGGIDRPPRYEDVIHWSSLRGAYDGDIQGPRVAPARSGRGGAS